MNEESITHFKPESIFTPDSPESKELSEKQELEFITDAKTGKIVKIGDPRDVREWLNAERANKPDLVIAQESGGVALPTITDAHHHLIYGTLDVIQAGYAFGVESSKEMIKSVKQQVKDSDKAIPKIIIGHNTATVPEIWRKGLDEASPNKPVCLVDASFHGARLNSNMLKLVEEAVEKEKKAGHKITGNINNKTGQATEGCALLAMQVAESYYGVEKIAEGVDRKLDEWINQGITDIHEMSPLSWEDFTAILLTKKQWKEERKTEFPVRQIFMTPVLVEKLHQQQKELERAGLFDPNRDWNLMGMKLVADGSFSSHTAMVKEQYKDTGGKGIEHHSIEELNKAIQMAREYGMDKIAMHAIGDAGIHRALETAKKWRDLAESSKIDPNKFRIEHFELSGNKEILDETKSLGVWVNSEPNFLTDYIYEDRLSGRITQICPHADIINRGIPMHFGSDGMPLCSNGMSGSALFGIWAATHHPNPKQRISFEQALSAYSLMAADYEHNYGRGRIAEGASADILVLDRKILNQMLQGDSSPEEFKKFGNDPDFLQDKVANLEAGIAKIYRQGQLVKK